MKESCDICGKVVSTTADPNDNEGFMITLVQAEQIDSGLPAHEEFIKFPRGWLRKHCPSVVMCESCRNDRTRQ